MYHNNPQSQFNYNLRIPKEINMKKNSVADFEICKLKLYFIIILTFYY